jgi:hypothetical protein
MFICLFDFIFMIVFPKYCYDKEIKEDDMGEAWSTHAREVHEWFE